MVKSSILQILWHQENAPVYSIDFQPHSNVNRFATAGGDNNVILWKIAKRGVISRDTTCQSESFSINALSLPQVQYLATLSRHTQAVNVVRFSPKGDLLASAGDDGNVLIWVQSCSHDAANSDQSETWTAKIVCRSMHAEIYDIAWSPDAQYIVTGSVDNAVRIFNAGDGKLVHSMTEHSHYVQGVAWDPCNQFIATQSSDRSLNVYSIADPFKLTLQTKISRIEMPNYSKCKSIKDDSTKSKFHMFHNETLVSFFRRLTFTPDGSLLLAPSGQYRMNQDLQDDEKSKDEYINTVFMFSRAGFCHSPVAHLPGQSKASITIKCSPVYYKLRDDNYIANKENIDTLGINFSVVIDLPYRIIYAVAAQDAAYVYDTQHPIPLCVIKNLHYASLTDLDWSGDGTMLLMASTDGFCSCVEFENGELGQILELPIDEKFKSSIAESIQTNIKHDNVDASNKIQDDLQNVKSPVKKRIAPIFLHGL